MKLEGKVVVAQGGGPTAVINQSLVGTVLESRKFANNKSIWCCKRCGGIINEEFLDLTQETTHNLESVAITLLQPYSLPEISRMKTTAKRYLRF